jgi:hypothetical protein
MTLDQFLNLLSTLFGAMGSIYVLKSILRQTPEITERQSATIYGHNPNLIDFLSAQKAEGIVGTSLIVIALIIAFANAAATPSDIAVSQNRLFAICLSLVLAAIVYLPLYLIGKTIDHHHRRDTARIMAAKTLDRLFIKKSISSYELAPEIKSLRYLNDKYLHLELSTAKTSKEFLRLIAKDAGRTVPDDIQIEDGSL